MTQLAASGVSVEFGATTLFRDVTVVMAKGDRWGVIGRNGSGKTTLIKLLAGEMEPTRGRVIRSPGLRIGMLEQHRTFEGASTVWEATAGPYAALLALEHSLVRQAEQIAVAGEGSPPALLARYDRDLERFNREGGYTFAPRVDAVLQGLGFDPTEARMRPIAHLSGGERGRVGLARQLVAPTDVLLLDEPTNHLDIETTEWLERYLRDRAETLMLISHDRAFLEGVVDHVLHLENETAVAYTGAYSAFVRQHAERQLTLQRAFDQQRRVLAREEDYIRRNIAGQNSKQARGRRSRLARLPRLAPPPDAESAMALRFLPGARGGDQAAVFDRLELVEGSRVLLRNFSAVVRRGDVIGFVGANGSGKSTLLRTLAGEREPTSGIARAGATVEVGHYRQDMAQVPLDRTLYEVINDLRPTWERGQILGHLARFGFSGDDVRRSASSLSGGERARVALAMLVLSSANLLLLDEPTNHLDVESIEALEDALEDYEGTVILVSHDRALLRSMASRVWVLHGATITDFDGSFTEWEEVTSERVHAASIAASEAEELRRVHERRTVARRDDDQRANRRALRSAQATLDRSEQEVSRLEQTVATLTGALEDPALYTAPDGGRGATQLGVELERARKALEGTLAAWSRAAEELEKLSGGDNTE